ncbi:MAG TPA: alanine--tRNA ligase [Clostridiales bacterium]|nr:alanine--tRNA ligase [Clostridiales bacterium]
MQSYGLNELREKYLSFFESKDHLRLPSFSLVPRNDPSILLINAGMTPLKPYFTGEQKPPHHRVTTCQKCIRTPDIERVGKTARHGTFFEMLGNFSFGDYFKKEAITWAWEFITQELKMPEDKLWVTIYEEDDEAFEIWNKDIGLSSERIVRMGKEDNFWEHGTGPCGPCSEIHFDRGADKGCGKPDCKIGCDCDRYIEFWNLVFTQFNKEADGTYAPLKKKNIDTGMGLERLACVMQNVDNLFEVDTVRNILNYVCKLAGTGYGKDSKTDTSIRVITDHIRSTTMMISDGIMPSNEGRGYVLRRLLRRAARHGKLLGLDKPFLSDVSDIVINESKTAYSELEEKRDYIKKVIKTEEERFETTINQGLAILNDYISQLEDEGKKVVPGTMVFKLHDTYGFPLDLTREIAEENGLMIDEAGFKKEMEVQKNKAREALKSKEGSAWSQESRIGLDKDFKTEFAGYGSTSCNASVSYILKDDDIVNTAMEGDKVVILLDKTPFYAESGGQVGDTGYIRTETGMVRVEDCKKTHDGHYLHVGIVEEGILESNTAAEAVVDVKRRKAIARNHTATHLLHKALRHNLGTHVAQAGSLVDDQKLRFDFTHFEPVSESDLMKIEEEINEKILEDLPVKIEEMELDKAREKGAMALFGEKYGNIVRVVQIDGYSIELCGGTHMTSTAGIGFLKITGETGVAAGTRRIEAVTGYSSLKYFRENEMLLNDIASTLKSSPQDAVKKIEALTSEIKISHKEIDQLRSKLVGSKTDEILSKAVEINDISVITAKFEGMDMEALRNTGDVLKNKLDDGVIILASEHGGKVNLIVTATKSAVEKGIHSGNIIREVAKVTGGGGGGRPDMAQAGGKDPSKIDEAFKKALEIVKAGTK